MRLGKVILKTVRTLLRIPLNSTTPTGLPDSGSRSSSDPEEVQLWLSDMSLADLNDRRVSEFFFEVAEDDLTLGHSALGVASRWGDVNEAKSHEIRLRLLTAAGCLESVGMARLSG